jgi:hypothetical protein
MVDPVTGVLRVFEVLTDQPAYSAPAGGGLFNRTKEVSVAVVL